MRIVADLHIHSKYARATSPNCDLDGLSEWMKIKGIDVVATGDFTHPEWFSNLKDNLKDLETGLYEYDDSKFILSGEISILYPRGEKIKKMHIVVLPQNLENAAQINDLLGKFGNLKEDGRPTLKIEPGEFADIIKGVSKKNFIILAHVWTPWFSIFGSKSGVNSIEEAFGQNKQFVDAIETGLSSDPKMNWMISELDKYGLVSNSDCHSPQKLGREANLLELDKVSFDSITQAVKTGKGFVKTYEFYPEEGKYHYDGHRNCDVILTPKESERLGNKCPKCRKNLTVGVMHRVYDLADREYGFKPKNAVDFKYIVPLTILLSKVLKKGEMTKGVQEEYFRLIKYFGNEFAVYEANKEQLRMATTPEIAEAIERVNKQDVYWTPGYDGVFGELSFEKKETQKGNQKSLLEF